MSIYNQILLTFLLDIKLNTTKTLLSARNGKYLSNKMKSKIIIYIVVIVTGILITLLLRQVGPESVLHFISKWIELKFLSKRQNGTSLALLTLVEPKKPAFSVVVLPKQEIETGTGMIIVFSF